MRILENCIKLIQIPDAAAAGDGLALRYPADGLEVHGCVLAKSRSPREIAKNPDCGRGAVRYAPSSESQGHRMPPPSLRYYEVTGWEARERRYAGVKVREVIGR